MKRILNIFFALLFGAFAYVNVNDVDAFLWVAAYGAVAFLFALAGWAWRCAADFLA